MRKKAILSTLVVLALTPAVAGAAEVTYSENIRPIFESRCAGCHGPDSPEYPEWKRAKKKFLADSKGPTMATYSHLIYFTAWPDTGALMRRLDDGRGSPDGKVGNMYPHLGDSEEERQENLGLFKAWVGNWDLRRWKDVTKSDLDGISVPY